MIDQSSWCGYQYMGFFSELKSLRHHIHSANNDRTLYTNADSYKQVNSLRVHVVINQNKNKFYLKPRTVRKFEKQVHVLALEPMRNNVEDFPAEPVELVTQTQRFFPIPFQPNLWCHFPWALLVSLLVEFYSELSISIQGMLHTAYLSIPADEMVTIWMSVHLWNQFQSTINYQIFPRNNFVFRFFRIQRLVNNFCRIFIVRRFNFIWIWIVFTFRFRHCIYTNDSSDKLQAGSRCFYFQIHTLSHNLRYVWQLLSCSHTHRHTCLKWSQY